MSDWVCDGCGADLRACRCDDCAMCGGTGETWADDGSGGPDWEPCHWCRGTGTVR